MGRASTRESKRHRRAMPPPLRGTGPGAGCLAWALAYMAGCAGIFAVFSRAWGTCLGIPVALVLGGFGASYLYGLALLTLVRSRWYPRGVRCLVVFSNSPNWETCVRDAWLPRIGGRAVVLNWSERSSWRSSLAVRVFRHFCGTWRNYNPSVIVFRGLRRPYVFRFYEAFKQVKAGRPEYRDGLEAAMFEALGIDRPV